MDDFNPIINTIDEADETEIKNIIGEKGFYGIKAYLGDIENKWKDIPLNFGVTGESGVGKSSFINAFRKLNECDKDAAKVDEVETTDEARPFQDPSNSKLVLWDLPGVGTPTFPKDKYLSDERVGFDKYDAFFLLYAGRFTENDLWLIKTFKERKKLFYVLRTKIDEDVSNRERRSQKEVCVADLLKTLTEDFKKHIKDISPDTKVYCIANYDTNNPQYDFGKVSEQLLEDFEEYRKEKLEALVLSVHSITPRIIEQKAKVLENRIWKMSCLSAAGSALPIPGSSLVVDSMIVSREIGVYQRQLWLEQGQLEKLAAHAGVPLGNITKHLSFVSLQRFNTKIITEVAKQLSISEGAESIAKCFPIVGSVFAGTISFVSTYFVLKKVLSKCTSDAKLVYEIIMKKP